jgi:putative PIN family toxin of toxin-antitoxin system
LIQLLPLFVTIMLRVVLDTVVLVRCLLNRYSPWGVLIFDHGTEYEIVASPELLTEYVETIHRPELFTRYTPHAVQALFEYFSHADILELKNIPSVSRDPGDDMVIATAVHGGADYLVSEDKDLLDLQRVEDVTIVNAREFLKILTSSSRRAA